MYEMSKEIRDGITNEQEKRDYLKGQNRTSLVVQRLKIRLPMQRTRV